MNMPVRSRFSPIPQHKKGLIRLLSFMVIASMMTFSLAASDVAGTWKGSMETQAGTTQVVITIKPRANLAGDVRLAEYEGSIQNGKLAGEKISFETTLEPGKVSFSGTVAGDQMELNVVGTQGDQYKLNCVRQN